MLPGDVHIFIAGPGESRYRQHSRSSIRHIIFRMTDHAIHIADRPGVIIEASVDIH